jgi:hypothetical protein
MCRALPASSAVIRSQASATPTDDDGADVGDGVKVGEGDGDVATGGPTTSMDGRRMAKPVTAMATIAAMVSNGLR